METTDKTDDDGGGSGGKSRHETGVTSVRSARMDRMAIERGWLKGQRWPTDATATDIMKVQSERDLTLRERATLAVMTDIAGKDARIRQIAVKSAIMMESQNQADEQPDKQNGGVNVNVGIASNGPVQVYIPDNGRG